MCPLVCLLKTKNDPFVKSNVILSVDDGLDGNSRYHKVFFFLCANLLYAMV